MPSIIEVDTIKNKTGTQNTVLSTDGSGNNTLNAGVIKSNTGSNTGLTIASDGQITVNQNNPTITLGSNATGFTGVKVLDQWRLTTSFQGGLNPITNVDLNKLERVDTANQTTIGSAMTVDAGGIFTFPMTGKYLITFNSNHNLASGEVRYIETYINKVISGSATVLSYAYSHINNAQAATTYNSNYTNTTFDCTDTSTDKISFSVNTSDSTIYSNGSSVLNHTYMTFIRLGDT